MQELSTFGQRLRWLRDVTGVGARELSRLAHVSTGYATATESSTEVSPRFETVMALAKLFRVDPVWLGEGKGQAPDVDLVKLAIKVEREKGTAA